MDITRGVIKEYYVTLDNGYKRDLSSTEWAYRLLLHLYETMQCEVTVRNEDVPNR